MEDCASVRLPEPEQAKRNKINETERSDGLINGDIVLVVMVLGQRSGVAILCFCCVWNREINTVNVFINMKLFSVTNQGT